MKPTIRRPSPARPDDLDDILDMIRGLAEFERMADQVTFDPAAMREHLFGPDPAASVSIAEVDDAIAGMALWFRTFSTFLGDPASGWRTSSCARRTGGTVSARPCCTTCAR